MHRPLALSFCLIAACSSAPHAPPAPIEPDPVTSVTAPGAALPADSISPMVAVLHPDATSTVVNDGPLRAEVVPGMERLERISLLERGILCGTRTQTSPVCIGDDRSAARSIESLQPVKRLETRSGTHCSLFETGKLACSLVNESTGRPSSVASTAVSDFVIGLHGEVYALSSGGNVVANIAKDDGAARTKIVLRSVTEIAAAYAGVCARTPKGDIECTDETAPTERATHTINALSDAVEIDSDGVIRKKDGSLWVLGAALKDPFVAVRMERPDGQGLSVIDIGWDPDRCVITTDGGASCLSISTKAFSNFASRRVQLPRKAVKIRPRGAPCAELDNGTVACWGEHLTELKLLGLHTLELSPGSFAPRP